MVIGESSNVKGEGSKVTSFDKFLEVNKGENSSKGVIVGENTNKREEVGGNWCSVWKVLLIRD